MREPPARRPRPRRALPRRPPRRDLGRRPHGSRCCRWRRWRWRPTWKSSSSRPHLFRNWRPGCHRAAGEPGRRRGEAVLPHRGRVRWRRSWSQRSRSAPGRRQQRPPAARRSALPALRSAPLRAGVRAGRSRSGGCRCRQGRVECAAGREPGDYRQVPAFGEALSGESKDVAARVHGDVLDLCLPFNYQSRLIRPLKPKRRSILPFGRGPPPCAPRRRQLFLRSRRWQP